MPDEPPGRSRDASSDGAPGAPAGVTLLDRILAVLARWGVPVMMTGAYALLAATSETDTAGKAWMAVGLAFVFVVWFVFRTLTETAALSRAIHVGDVARLFELAARQLPRARRPADRAALLVGRALAYQLRGEPAKALAVLDEAAPGPALRPLAAATRISALVELGRPVAEARAARVAVPGAPALAWLADGMLAWRDDQLDEAAALFTRVINDIRAGGATRAIAHVYAARIAHARGMATEAGRHRAAAATLATPEATWLRAV